MAELAPIPGLLERTEHLAKRRRRSRTARLALAALAALAGGAVVALALIVPSMWAAQADPGLDVALQPIVATRMSATVNLTDEVWGTSVNVECSYSHDDAHYADPAAYALVAVDRDGQRTEVSNWNAVDDADVTVAGSTALSIDDITALVVVDQPGDDVMHAAVTG